MYVPPRRESPVEKKQPYDDDELIQARRALRTASWAAVFYLITTDILGPFNAPFAFSQVGYVPGAILYVVSESDIPLCFFVLSNTRYANLKFPTVYSYL